MPKNSKRSDQWAALLSDALKHRERRPPGLNWRTFSELYVAWDIGAEKARRMVTELVAQKRLEIFRGTEQFNGKLVQRVWYRPKS